MQSKGGDGGGSKFVHDLGLGDDLHGCVFLMAAARRGGGFCGRRGGCLSRFEAGQ
jgi:hypothetical protein